MGLRLNRHQGFRPNAAGATAVSVQKCRGCELVYSDPLPIPQDISDHYAVEADVYFVPTYLDDEDISLDTTAATALLGGAGKALDIGAGIGKVMRTMTERGWDMWGIEPSPQFARRAIANGVPADRLTIAGVEDADFPAETFGLVTFGAVLEHLPSPGEMLAKAVTWLRPGGIIHAEVPSSRWTVARLVNAYYRVSGMGLVTNLSPMHPPYHLFEFSHRSFEAHGARAGYSVAQHNYWAGEMPQFAHRILRPIMQQTGTGMQLTVWLRKHHAASRANVPIG